MNTFVKPCTKGKVVSISKKGKTFHVYIPSKEYVQSKRKWDNNVLKANDSNFGERANAITRNYHTFSVLKNRITLTLMETIFELNKQKTINYKKCPHTAYFQDVLEKPQVLNAMTIAQ